MSAIRNITMLQVPILIFVLQLKLIFACESGYYSWAGPVDVPPEIEGLAKSKEESFPEIALIKNHVDRNRNRSWGGWTPPPEVITQWRDWLHEWEIENNGTNLLNMDKDKENANKLLAERGIGSGWPSGWLDLGQGHGGADPPPWAYVPTNTGKPEECMLPPRYGKCKNKEKRWGYNPYTNKCEEFQYSGCGGNNNNFLSLQKCDERCVAPPPSGCDSDSHIYIENVMFG